MSSDQPLICVKRPEPGLSAVFEEMYLNERLVDVTLSCSDGQLQAHKLVLAASSPYFSSLFDKLANPFHYPVIVIKDMRIEDLKMIIDFMYRGQLTVSQDRLVTLMKSAENLQITGLTPINSASTHEIDVREGPNGYGSSSSNGPKAITGPRYKRTKKSSNSLSISNHGNGHHSHHQNMFARSSAYQSGRQDGVDSRLSPQPAEKLLEQSMITGDAIDDSHLFTSSYSSNDPTSTRNLSNSHQQHLHSSSSMQIQHVPSVMDHQNQLSNQLQVLSHSLAANRSSLSHSTTSTNNQQSGQPSQQTARGRVHPCNICWKTFREKANLKRHLQVHSLDRVVYACPDCNKTFSWKDNYIRHTKTAHHINNVRPQT